ncbi:hypothetical protein WA026_009534 [Henosepilachna vigintioctopunctata]|uniref:tRNA (carboxymethyluridine(34)-5-O)-methyltransferase n=1 Tax=Henosepilachna vigintioctopunctata TaxID=420089 RepID=A0AAW1U4X2_9CUCU
MKILIICNAGLVNGLSEEVLVDSLKEYGELSNILLPPGKSYCFVSFTTVENSKSCCDSCNGLLNIAQDNKPIYLCFIETLPNVVDEIVWDTLPPGLIILENFINDDEEKLLLELPNFRSLESGNMKNRQVKHYGFEFKYNINNVDKNDPLPDEIPNACDFLWPRLPDKFGNFIPDQCTVNQYLPGQGIPSHVDTHSAFEDPIMSLSLGSSVVMDFKNGNKHYCILLPGKSLLIMSGESRYLWTHGITPRKFDIVKKDDRCNLSVRGLRISYTFRRLRHGECMCDFINKCDSWSQKTEQFSLDDNEIALKLEEIHVHQVYENIADHFSDTRHKPWPNIVEFIESLEDGSILVDVGCGNGKYLGLNKSIFNVGCDRSSGLINVCKDRGFQCFTSDCLSITLRDGSADACICIAVIHHLANSERRLNAIKEIVRILRPGGRALIYVWAKDQFSNNEKSNYIKEDKRLDQVADADLTEVVPSVDGVQLPIHINRTQFKHKDLLVPWKLKRCSENKGTFLRYYHVYEKHELENDCGNIPSVKITSSYYDQGNWCVIIEKIKK